MAFEKYTQTGRGYKPKISIWGKGQIGFNQGAKLAYELEKYQFVEFYYDKENKKIGLKFTQEAGDGAKNLKLRGTGASASAKAFLDYYGILYEGKTKTYDVIYDNENQLYVIDLNKATDE